MIIEILSDSTKSIDKFKKFNIYLEAGVREYWIVDPFSRFVETYILKNGEYVYAIYDDKSILPVYILESFTINLAEVFEPIEDDPTITNETPLGFLINEKTLGLCPKPCNFLKKIDKNFIFLIIKIVLCTILQ